MRIAVACDGSKQSEQVLKLALSLPFKDKKITLVNVAPLIQFDPEYISEDAMESIEVFNEDLRQKSNKLLEAQKAVVAASGLTCESVILEGDPAIEVCKYCEDHQVDLIGIGSRGMNPVKSFFLGSVSDSVIRRAGCSVLLYKDGAHFDAKGGLKIVVGYDDTPSSRDASIFLNQMDLSKVAAIDLVSVIQMSYHYGMNYALTTLETWPKYRQTLEESLVKWEQGFAKQAGTGTKVESEIITDVSNTADALNDFCKQKGHNLVVVGTSGKNSFDRFFLGSVSNRLAHHSETPVLIVRP